ncbi:hypothetical protein EVAR_31308_1 [Eumeta japonica]|uniref:Uncharacterized protein n=1 Tax=Eumeta variegata TaxID=151549 RepID=A0A4C1VR72_EUMVA|nr:hypothetical protein EVAR_31308_1 [Eumeta japonica]
MCVLMCVRMRVHECVRTLLFQRETRELLTPDCLDPAFPGLASGFPASPEIFKSFDGGQGSRYVTIWKWKSAQRLAQLKLTPGGGVSRCASAARDRSAASPPTAAGRYAGPAPPLGLHGTDETLSFGFRVRSHWTVLDHTGPCWNPKYPMTVTLWYWRYRDEKRGITPHVHITKTDT